MNKTYEKQSEVHNTEKSGKIVPVYEFGENFKPKKKTMEWINGAPYYEFFKIEGNNGPIIDDSVFPITNVTAAGSSSGAHNNEPVGLLPSISPESLTSTTGKEEVIQEVKK